jgi:integrator complex subunit 4
MMVRILQPLLLAHPLESLAFNSDVAMSRAVIYDPSGMNETPLKYTAGMVLAVPVDCELFNVRELSLVRVAIKTPDQKIQLVTPKSSQFFQKEDRPNCYRLLTDALMSHQVWSEALHVEISIVLDLSATMHGEAEGGKRNAKGNGKEGEKNIIHLCQPVKVYVLPKGVKRGL